MSRSIRLVYAKGSILSTIHSHRDVSLTGFQLFFEDLVGLNIGIFKICFLPIIADHKILPRMPTFVGELSKRQVSIHAPREGRDELAARFVAEVGLFQSARPVKGAT